jgi:ribosomal subunit interface protein
MDIRVIGSNMDVGESLKQYVEEHVNRHVTKYFDTAIFADVHFSKQGSGQFHVNIVVNEGVKGGGIVIKSNYEAGDIYGCFNEAMSKAAKQLRRYKRRIKNYRRDRGGLKISNDPAQMYDASKYIISVDEYLDIEENEQSVVEREEKPTSLNIVTEKTTDIEELSVDDAIMKMDLANLPALVFVNKDNQRINVVYHRKDGNISWIDPENKNN